MKQYLVILADRKRAHLILVKNGKVVLYEKLPTDLAPRKVKHGQNDWDAPDKILRKRNGLLDIHLENISKSAIEFTKNIRIDGVVFGGHQDLHHKIAETLTYPLKNKFIGFFITELKIPQNQLTEKALQRILELEKEKEEKKIQEALS